MNYYKQIFYYIILILSIDFIFSIYRIYRRTNVYQRALSVSKFLNKKLLVIGNPTAGFCNKNIYKAYDCGDICLDLNGCDDCQSQIKGDVLEELKKLDTNSFVIYESCVLEYVDSNKIPEVRQELFRVSGGDYYEVRIFPNIIPLNTNLKFIELGILF